MPEWHLPNSIPIRCFKSVDETGAHVLVAYLLYKKQGTVIYNILIVKIYMY